MFTFFLAKDKNPYSKNPIADQMICLEKMYTGLLNLTGNNC